MAQETLFDYLWEFDCNLGNYNLLIKSFAALPNNLDSALNLFHNTEDIFGFEIVFSYIPDETIKDKNELPKFDHTVI